MTPLLPLLVLGGGLLWLRSQANKTPSKPSAAGPLGSKLGRPLTPEQNELQRRRELTEFLLGGRKRKSAAPPMTSPASPPFAAPAAPEGPKVPEGLKGCIDDGVPEDLLAELIGAWESSTLSILNFAEIASVLAEEGWPKASVCFAQKAEKMVEKAGGLPHVIRSGDIPSLMAAYYTGDASRFKELGKLNKKLGKLVTTNGVTNYQKWVVGTEILIPSGWKPLTKPVPPVASQAPKDSDLVAAGK
jgi:hypothetical protein